MSFTDQKPRIATEDDCTKTRWSGRRPGVGFRCYLCGYKFVPGDVWRWVCTNGGNPIVCAACDGPDIKERWAKMCTEAKNKFWWFTEEHFYPSHEIGE